MSSISTKAIVTRGPRRRAGLRLGRLLRGNPGMIVGSCWLGIVVLGAALLPFLGLPSPFTQDLTNVLGVPSAEHLLGTDQLGRDTLARLLYGARYSLMLGLSAVALAFLVGVPIGIVSGFIGGRTDLFLQRVVDVVLAFPGFLLALLVIAVLGTSAVNVSIAVAISATPSFIRLARAVAIELSRTEFVEAARMLNVKVPVVMLKHVFPHVLPVTLVNATMTVGTAIIEVSGLGFLGLGVQAPNPEWGTMLSEARDTIFQHPLQTLFPGLMIAFTVLSFNLIGDGLRDELDPKYLRKVR